MVEPGLRERLQEVTRLQSAMLQCLADEDVEQLGVLDHRCRALFQDLDIASIGPSDAELVAGAMRNFLEFHRELQRACEEQRDQAAADLKLLRAARKGAQSYQDMEDRNR